jgi:hypothetical protein
LGGTKNKPPLTYLESGYKKLNLKVINRSLSLLIALIILYINHSQTQNTAHSVKTGFCLLVILSLIWFGDQIGSFTGYIGRGGHIDTESPGWLVCIFGWIFLLGGPLLMWMINS